ncbi:MAG: glycoside hydrolase family 57 [Gammaproteobacteria bacterium]
MAEIFHALALNLHQPEGNLEALWEQNQPEAIEILQALHRLTQALASYDDRARVHVSLSGTLLDTLASEDFQPLIAPHLDCHGFLRAIQNRRIFEILGTAYYHPVLPIIPASDWDDHLARWADRARYLFGRTRFPGFWPPEMGFCMELIPHLKRLGYRYALVDSEHVEPRTPMSAAELGYRPHIAEFGGDELVIVVRDRALSNAVLSGMDCSQFQDTVRERTKECSAPALVTLCANGDNGERFRSADPHINFWSSFYVPLLAKSEQTVPALKATFIHDYLDRYGTHGRVYVGPGAWNTPWHDGKDFVQWTGSAGQREALTRLDQVSQAFHTARANVASIGAANDDTRHQLEEAHRRILRAETSCHFFWGEAWVPRCHQDLDEACTCLERAWGTLGEG